MILTEEIEVLGDLTSSITLFRTVHKLEKFVTRKQLPKISCFELLLIFYSNGN